MKSKCILAAVFLLVFQAVSQAGGTNLSDPVISAPVEQSFLRGDANADGVLSIADVTALLRFVFSLDGPPPCLDAADATDDGRLDIADAVWILRQLWSPEILLPPPVESCGFDQTPDRLTCDAFPPCSG